MKGSVCAVFGTLLLGACANSNSLSFISAEPLVIAPADVAAAQKASAAKREFLGSVIYQSEQKCAAFLSNLAATQGSLTAIGDIVSGTLSGVASFTTPVATSHILSGLATVATGAKTAVTNDFFAKASIANFATALQTTYFAGIGKYASDLETKSDNDIVVAIELSRIQGFHSACGLAPAQTVIQTSIAPKEGDKAPPAGGSNEALMVPRGPLTRSAAPAPVAAAIPGAPGAFHGNANQTPYMRVGSPVR